MNDETQSILRQVYALIENGDLDAARAMLSPVLEREPDNADAWWLYTHTVSDPYEAQRALENVVRIDANYPGAAALLSAARQQVEQTPARPTIKPLAPASVPEVPPELPEIYQPAPQTDEIPDPTLATPISDEPPMFERTPASESETETPPTEQRRGILAPLLAVLVIIALIAVAVIVLTQQDGQPPEPTAVSVLESPEPTLPAVVETPEVMETPEVEIVETDEPVETTAEPLATPSLEIIVEITPELTGEATIEAQTVEETPEAVSDDRVLEALEAFTLADDAVQIIETPLGDSLIAAVCATPGREVRQLTQPVMEALALVSDEIDAEAVGVRFVNCAADGATLLVLAASIEDARAFAEDEISQAEFSQSWQAVQL